MTLVNEATVAQVLAAADAATDELIALHQELVRIPTVNTGHMPTGGETVACALLADFFTRNDIPCETHESAPGRGNLIARIDGQTAHPSLLLMSHTDVVPVEDETVWTYPPFSGAIQDGKVWGRGSSDAKSLVSTGAMCLALLRRHNIPLHGSLRFLAAADEETGGEYGAGWVAEHLSDRIRADVALNEGAGGPLQTPGGLVFSIANGEKGRYEVHITVRGKSGHAAAPWRSDNALHQLADVLQRILAYQPELNTAHPTFAAMAALYRLSETPTAANIDRLAAELPPDDELAASLLRATSRMTLTPTMVHAGLKSNSIPAAASLTCDVRTLPHQDAAYVHNQVVRLLHGIPRVEIRVVSTAISTASAFDTPFLDACTRAVGVATGRPDATLLPTLTGGFTDSRFFRPLGTKVYNFMPSHVTADTRNSGVHGVDENIEIAALRARLRFMVALAVDYLGEG